MALDGRAKAYADNFTPLFVSRYNDAVRAGHAEVVPRAIRATVEAYIHGTVTAPVDVNRWVWKTLYSHRVMTGQDFPLPPDYSRSDASSGSNGAEVGMAVASGLFNFAKVLFRLLPTRL